MMTNYKHKAGFTLIELMIVVAIVGILAAIVYPSYVNNVVKSNRAATQSFMSAVASREEQFLLDSKQYPTVADNSSFVAALNISVPTEVSKFYDLQVTNPSTVRTFQIQAAPKAGTIQANDGTLTLDNTGAKTPTGKW